VKGSGSACEELGSSIELEEQHVRHPSAHQAQSLGQELLPAS